MRRQSRFVALGILLLGAVSTLTAQQASKVREQAPAWTTKVDAAVLREAQSTAGTDFIILLNEQADLSSASVLPTRQAKGEFVVRELQAAAARTQPALLAKLRALGVTFTPYWIANLVVAHGDVKAVEAVAGRADVAHLFANARLVASPLPVGPASKAEAATQAIEWNISKIGAPQAWAEGYRGQGVVIGGQDTGYKWDHPAIINQYLGWNGTAADHNYHWHDATVDGLRAPADDLGHGTHTMGIALGNDLSPSDPGWPAAAGNAVGVAPGARWIGCRNMKNGVGTIATYTECYQWFIAPTDLNDQNPNPTLAPDIIINSWACTVSEGCTDAEALALLAPVQSVTAAGILTVHAAGNKGPNCSSVTDPATIYAESFSIGSTNSSDTIASDSGRGPVTRDGSGRMKPDVSAPGVLVRSAYATGYQLMSGTSMATPHVAGAAALILSGRPQLAGNVAALRYALTRSAVPLTTTQGCGGDSASAVPNNVYGWGRLDAHAAVHRIVDTLLLTVASVGPASGPAGGGTTVTITGTGFAAGDTVSFGGVAATGVTVIDATRMTMTTPPHATSIVDVVVMRTDQQTAVRTSAFTYGSPAFTDDPLAAGAVAVRAVHVLELRLRIGELRSRYGLSPIAWTDTLVSRATVVKAQHITELRAALAEAYGAATRFAPVYTDSTLTPAQTRVAATHITEIRNAILSLW
ncbi:MAG TPA: S8 family serine peptidase [Vicinamibacterales bacterium]|jgi:subtilisin family serine protease